MADSALHGPADIVTDAYTSSRGYANEMMDLAIDNATNLGLVVPEFGPISYGFTGTGVNAPAPNFSPVAITSNYTLAPNYDPGNPGAVSLSPLGSLPSAPDAGDYYGTPPVVDASGLPSNSTAVAPTLANPPVYIDAPDDLVYVAPAVPTLDTINIPADIVFQPVDFTATAPTLVVATPDLTIQFNETLYDSPLVTAYTAYLLDDITNGATGLPAAIEQALWDRARSREELATIRLKDDANADFLKRGFTMPPGALAKRRLQAERDALNTAATLNRDIAIKQAELIVENAKFAITSAMQAESQLMSYSNSLAQRSFDAAKTNSEFLVALYKLRVDTFNAEMQGYATEAQVFKQLLESELARASFYKTQVEGAKLKNDINAQDIALYEAQLQGIQTLADVYKAEVSAYAAYNDAEKTKIEAFKVEVDAYSSQVGAKTEEFKAYATKVGAEETKVRAFTAQVGAYGTAVAGYKAHVDAQNALQRTDIDRAKLEIDKYNLKLTRYSSALDAETKRVDALAKKDSALIGANATVARMDEARMNAATAASAANAQISISNAQGSLAAATSSAQVAIQSAKMQSDALATTAQVAGQLAAAALGVTTTSAAISGQDSYSVSRSKNNESDPTYSINESREG